MKLLQINTTLNYGSTGRIAGAIGNLVLEAGSQSFIGFGRGDHFSSSQSVRIGNNKDLYFHVLKSRLTDRHGFGSRNATKAFIRKIEQINPDIIHLHNIHGYYLNVKALFSFLKESDKPVIWTLHDCWPFTGHCCHFERIACYRWQTICFRCPNIGSYPGSWILDQSERNYQDKKNIFTSLNKLNLVVPSQWLANHVKNSFLREYPIRIIRNGINLEDFKIMNDVSLKLKYNIGDVHIILGVASTWKKRKALDDFIKLSSLLNDDERIVLVGLDRSSLSGLPSKIIPVARTENTRELASFYSMATVFINPTYADTFPTTNLEALACGTPVITYDTGGSPESIDHKTGSIVSKGDISGFLVAIRNIIKKDRAVLRSQCRERAETHFNQKDRFSEYLNLYDSLLKVNKHASC